MDYWFNLRMLLTRPQRKSDRAVYEFIGSDGSMGLRRGQVMPLSVYMGNGRLFACWNGGCCPYDTVEAFSRNWRLCNVPD
jgi:hypothetical protein|nr:MAG TPA: hypothetical protein [Caudoviricetes sp.]